MMSEHKPDNWIMLKINLENEILYKILGGWSGGYLDGDSFRINSGVTKATKDGDYFVFEGHSGSKYYCHKNNYMIRMNIAGVLGAIQEKYPNIIQMPDDTDWLSLDYSN